MKKISENGTVLLIVSSALFTVMSLLARYTMRDLPASEVTFARNLVGCAVCLAIFVSKAAPLELGRPGMLAVRGILGGTAVFLYFKTIGLLSAGEATLLNNTSVVFIAILAPFVLGERVTVRLAAIVGVALAGIALVVRADVTGPLEGKFFGLLTAFFSALAIMTIRSLRKDHGATTIFFFFSVGGLVVSFGTLCAGWRVPSFSVASLLLAMGLSAAGAQLLFTQALRYTRALESNMFSQLTVVWTSMAEVAMWNLPITVQSAAGAALIIGACIHLNTVLSSDPGDAPSGL